MWYQATSVLSHGKTYFRHDVPKCRYSHREHRQDDGTRINCKYADLCAGNGLQDFGGYGQTHRQTLGKEQRKRYNGNGSYYHRGNDDCQRKQKRKHGRNGMNTEDRLQTGTDSRQSIARSYFEWGNGMQVVRRSTGDVAMTEGELARFFGVT